MPFFFTDIYPFIWPHCNISLHKAVFYYVTCEISPQWHFCKKALLYITFSYNVQWTICIIKFRQTDNSNFATSYTVYISVPKLTLHNYFTIIYLKKFILDLNTVSHNIIDTLSSIQYRRQHITKDMRVKENRPSLEIGIKSWAPQQALQRD